LPGRAYLYRRTQPRFSAIYFFATTAAELVGAAGLLRVLGLLRWEEQALILMLIPIAHAVALTCIATSPGPARCCGPGRRRQR